MRNTKLVQRNTFDAAVFVRYFVAALQGLRTDDDLKSLGETIRNISDYQWRLETVDPLNQLSSLSLLHTVVLSVIFYASSKKIKLSLLVDLIRVSPFELWEIRPPVSKSTNLISEILKLTPREALLQLCEEPDSTVYLSALTELLVNMPLELWAKDVAEYLKLAKKLLITTGENIQIDLSSFLEVLSRNDHVDLQVWFDPIFQGAGFLSIVMSCLGKRIQTIDRDVQKAVAAGTLQSFARTQECIVKRRSATYLIRIIYEIVKRSSAQQWDPIVDVNTLSISNAPLNDLLDLMLIGFRHELIMKIAQHVLFKASDRAIEYIFPEQKEKISKIDAFSAIISTLEKREKPAVDLMNTLYLFSESCSKSYLILLVVSSEEYVSRLMQLTEAEMIESQVGMFSAIAGERWSQELVYRNCPPKLVGMTLLHAIVSVLIEKLSNPDSLSAVLMNLVECVPAEAWDQSPPGKKVSTGAKSSSDFNNSPRHLIWKLCQRENGNLFLSILIPILNSIPSQRSQAEIPEYLRLVLKLFVKQGVELELTVAEFFSLLVSKSLVEVNNLFSELNLNVGEKQKQKEKGSAVVVTSPICVLIDTINAILKKESHDPKIFLVLTNLLKLIAERTSGDDWDPRLTTDGKLDQNGPLNRLVRLLFNDEKNACLSKVVEIVLGKATQESVNFISMADREKILKIPEFAKNKKLLSAPCEKKPVPRESAVKIAPKPVAKKAVAPVSDLCVSAKKPDQKKQASKLSVKSSVALPESNVDVVVLESSVPILPKQLSEAAITPCQPVLPKNTNQDESDDDAGYYPPVGLPRPTLAGAWNDDDDDCLFEKNDVSSENSVQYRYEPYSLFYNHKVMVKSGHDVNVNDVAVPGTNKKRII